MKLEISYQKCVKNVNSTDTKKLLKEKLSPDNWKKYISLSCKEWSEKEEYYLESIFADKRKEVYEDCLCEKSTGKYNICSGSGLVKVWSVGVKEKVQTDIEEVKECSARANVCRSL